MVQLALIIAFSLGKKVANEGNTSGRGNTF
jgi:hypothetical protein